MDVEVLSWGELEQRAGSRARARREVAEESMRRVVRGWYVRGDVQDSPGVRCAVLRRALPEGVALAGRTSLWAMGVDVLPRSGLLNVVTERGKHLEPRPWLRPWSAKVTDAELVDLPGGLVAVSAPRAFVDVARREDLVEAVALGDAVLRSGAATTDQLHAAVARAAKLRGVVGAREVLPHLEPRAESQGESRLRMRLVLAGLPRPEAQVDLYDQRGRHIGRIDLVLHGALLEYDGRERDVVRDSRRQNLLVDLGGHVRRYSNEDVWERNAVALAADVTRAVRRAPSLSPRLHRGPDTLRPPRLHPLPTRAQLARRAA